MRIERVDLRDHIFMTSTWKGERGWGSWNFLHICRFCCFWTVELLFTFAVEGVWEIKNRICRMFLKSISAYQKLSWFNKFFMRWTDFGWEHFDCQLKNQNLPRYGLSASARLIIWIFRYPRTELNFQLKTAKREIWNFII